MITSLFTWLDTSDRDRRRALDVVDLFSVRDTRDELGIGAVRDAWADRLAPGTSTLQRRARYFLFVPWMYRRLEAQGYTAKDVARRARKLEVELIEAIERTDPEAVPIGARAAKGLKRLPSSIYWNGLGVWRVRLFDGSQERFHRQFGRGRGHEFDEVAAEREERGVATVRGDSGAWNPHLPPAPEDFPERVEMALTRREAEFLRDQVRLHANGSLLQFLMDDEGSRGLSGVDVLAKPEAAPRDFPWDHPRVGAMPAELRGWLMHARNFSLVMHGAALLYNRMVGELARYEEAVERHGDRLAGWAKEVGERRAELVAWKRDEFWSETLRTAPRLPRRTIDFAEKWIDLVLGHVDAARVTETKEARLMVERREVELKRARSRLKSSEQRAKWTGSSGSNRIDYRWAITKLLVDDVHAGLGRS